VKKLPASWVKSRGRRDDGGRRVLGETEMVSECGLEMAMDTCLGNGQGRIVAAGRLSSRTGAVDESGESEVCLSSCREVFGGLWLLMTCCSC
jgi:hypothetical protein